MPRKITITKPKKWEVNLLFSVTVESECISMAQKKKEDKK